MKMFKKGKMLSKKTISIILAGLVIVAGTIYVGVNSYKEKNEANQFETREREYKVTRGNITAGVKGNGSLKFEGVKHNFDEEVIIGEVFVKDGQNVIKGDKLVSISEKYLDEKLEELNKALNTAQLALEQAEGSKRSTVLSNDKAWNEKVQGTKSQYESQKRELVDNINNLNDRLANVNTQLEEVRKQIDELSAKGEENNLQIEELKVKESALISEQSSIQGELDSANKRLSNLEADRQKQLESESNEYAANSEINNINLNGLDGAIASAQGEVNKVQEEINKINKLKESPILYANTDGIVSAINAKVGDKISAGVSIVDIGESAKVTADLTISQNDIVNIEVGQEVTLEISTYQDEKFKGKVTYLNLKPNSQGNSTTYSATVELEPTDYKLLEGMTVSAQFIIKEVKDVIMLSNKAIVLKDGKQFVKLKNEDGSTTEVEIQTGFSDGKNTEITGGLNEGDTVVIGG